jgi:homogentisate 1,2-dioxygenase
MVPYQKRGQVAERPHLGLPSGTYEEELGLDGFFGPVSHIYHLHPPTQWTHIQKSEFQWRSSTEQPAACLLPQCFKKVDDPLSRGDFFNSALKLFWNEDLSVWTHRITESSPVYFRNADASELLFCHEGKGYVESPFGQLSFEAGDYLSIPKGISYRIQIQSPSFFLRVESFRERFKRPDRGLLGQQALYHEEGILAPDFKTTSTEKTSRVRVQASGLLTDIDYAFDLREVAGWMGTCYPWKLSVKNIAPVMSHVAHLPPSINSTFVTSQFIVCTFLPRPLEEPEAALKVPFFHSNIDFDEVIFYHAGDFFSRDNMAAGYITLHPRGINHGPHPKALANQQNAKRTNEIAVMIDTVKPLKVSAEARGLELKDYWKSWMKP